MDRPESDYQLVDCEFEGIILDIEKAIESIPVPPGLDERILMAIQRERVLDRQRTRLSELILLGLGIPFLFFFSPYVFKVFKVFYGTASALVRAWPTLSYSVFPIWGVGLMISGGLLALIGILGIRALWKGLRWSEVLS